MSVILQLPASLLLLSGELFKVSNSHRRFLFDFLGLRMVELLRGIWIRRCTVLPGHIKLPFSTYDCSSFNRSQFIFIHHPREAVCVNGDFLLWGEERVEQDVNQANKRGIYRCSASEPTLCIC